MATSNPTEPSPCYSSFSTEAGGLHYSWRGWGPGKRSTTIGVFDKFTEQWSLKPTTGSTPPGLFLGSCVCVGDCLYTFGGGDGSSTFNNIYKLNINTHQWSEVEPSGSLPMKKNNCSLLHIDDNMLCCFGGQGIGPTQQPGATFTKDTRFSDGRGWTNELHLFNTQNGVWSSPDIRGERPPPCAFFTFTKVDQHKAVLFGGRQSGRARVDDVYLFNLMNMEFTKMEPVPGEPWPVGRSAHAACCLNYSEEHPQLLVSGGVDNDNRTLRDIWVLDVDAGKWTEVTPRESHKPRLYHSITATSLVPGLVEVLMFGGCHKFPKNVRTDDDFVPVAKTTLLRFELTDPSQSVAGPSTRKWALVDVAHNNTRGSSQRLREKLVKIIQAANRPSSVRESSSSQDRVRDLEQQLLVTNDLLQQKEWELAEANHYCKATEQRARLAELAAERRVQELNADICQLQEDLERTTERAQLAEERADGLETQWVVQRSEIRMTERELGVGGWGAVRVAEFRGIEVAAKSLFEQIQSPYYQHLFIREMNMAARLRHPNLVQFIGATLEGGMIILTELMHTSLRRVLEGGAISRETIVSVSVQVCQALNYLHLMQPDPVIHRDISSANVLLNPLPNNCWRAKVTDYGSVNTLRALQTENPGNPVYAAPEARISSLQSPKMDIFSLGVLLIEMCTGQFPSDDGRERLLFTIQDRQFSDIIRCCINRERDNRPTALELIRELQ